MSERADERRTQILAGLRSDGAARLDALALLLRDEAPAGIVDGTVVDALMELLGDDHRTQQRRASEVVQALLDSVPELAQRVEAAIDAPSARLRWGATYTLGQAGRLSLQLWPSVRETMALEDGDQRWAAGEIACALARVLPEVDEALHEATTDSSPVLRKMALYCLRDLAAPRLRELGRRALDDPEPTVRLAGLALCAKAPGPDAPLADHIAALVAEDPVPGVQRAAAATLGRLAIFTPTVVSTLEAATHSPDPTLPRAAHSALQKRG